jgi:inner membrane protein
MARRTTMLWWQWIALGLVMAGLEMLGSNVFFFIFFGISAGVVGLLTLLGLAGPPWVQWLLFSIFSLGLLMAFRNPLKRLRSRIEGVGIDDSLAGEIAIPLDDIAPGSVGRAELRGTVWSARNLASVPIAKGRRCVVARVEGLMLVVQPEGAE